MALGSVRVRIVFISWLISEDEERAVFQTGGGEPLCPPEIPCSRRAKAASFPIGRGAATSQRGCRVSPATLATGTCRIAALNLTRKLSGEQEPGRETGRGGEKEEEGGRWLRAFGFCQASKPGAAWGRGREVGAVALPSQRQLQRQEQGGKPRGGKQAPNSPRRGRQGYLSRSSAPLRPSPASHVGQLSPPLPKGRGLLGHLLTLENQGLGAGPPFPAPVEHRVERRGSWREIKPGLAG